MMGIASEIGSIGLLAIGKDPKASTPEEWQQAADKLMEQKPLVRSYYDASYLRALKNEDIWITMAWSGDIFYAATYQGYDTLKVVIPDEGAMFWTDYMMIPYTAQNPLDAMTYMDSVFDPKVAAEIADYVGYVCPVPAAQEIIRTDLDDPTSPTARRSSRRRRSRPSRTTIRPGRTPTSSPPGTRPSSRSSRDSDGAAAAGPAELVPADPAPPRRRARRGKRLAPYLLGPPAGLWLVIFFLIPLVTMLSLSLQTCDPITLACRLTWRWGGSPMSSTRTRGSSSGRSPMRARRR